MVLSGAANQQAQNPKEVFIFGSLTADSLQKRFLCFGSSTEIFAANISQLEIFSVVAKINVLKLRNHIYLVKWKFNVIVQAVEVDDFDCVNIIQLEIHIWGYILTADCICLSIAPPVGPTRRQTKDFAVCVHIESWR